MNVLAGLTILCPLAQTRNKDAIPEFSSPTHPSIYLLRTSTSLSHHTSPLRVESHSLRTLLRPPLPALLSHLRNLISKQKRSSLAKLGAFCCRAEPLWAQKIGSPHHLPISSEGLRHCGTQHVPFLRRPGVLPGVAATTRLVPPSPGPWRSGSPTAVRSGPDTPPLTPQDSLNMRPAARTSLSSQHRALGNVLIRWSHWFAYINLIKTMKFSRAEPTMLPRAAALSSRTRMEAQVKGLVADASRACCPLLGAPPPHHAFHPQAEGTGRTSLSSRAWETSPALLCATGVKSPDV